MMTRRSGNSEATFYFQAWHVDKVVSGESWLQNKAFADFVEQNLIGNARRWLFIKACVPTKERAGLLVPYSICVKLRAAKIGQNPEDADRAILQFRDREFPSIAKSYFLTRLHKSLDFFNAYAESHDSESLPAKFEVVKSSTQLKERVQAAIRYVKKESWGDLIHGLVDGGSPGSEFKAARFISKRGQDPAANPHLLPPAPLQQLLLPSCTNFPLADCSELPAIEVASTAGSISDASSDYSSSDETSQSSIPDEASECYSNKDASESCEVANSTTASSASDAVQLATSASTQPSTTTYEGGAIAPRRKMTYTMAQDSRTAVFVLQNAGNWLQYLMAARANGGQQFGVFDSPILVAAAVDPLQAVKPDGMMRVFFMSQARRQREEAIFDKRGRVIRRRKGKATREWIIGSAKVSTRSLTMHFQKSLGSQRNGLLSSATSSAGQESWKVDSVVGPNNQLIEMTPAPDIPQAIIVTTQAGQEIKDGEIIEEEKDDGFVHIETKNINRVVEIKVAPQSDTKINQPKQKSQSKGKHQITKDKTNSGTPPRKPAKQYSHPFSRRSWRDQEPQAPQLICDVTTGQNFLHVEDVEIFSFSALTHDMMLNRESQYYHATTSTIASSDDGDGIGVWPPPVVGIFGWVWDHFGAGASSKMR